MSEDRIRLVRSGIDLDWARGRREGARILPPRGDIRRALADECRADKERLFILAVGALTSEKGHRDLIDAMPMAMERFPGAHLLLVGAGKLAAGLAPRAKKRGLTGNVSFLGERADIPALMSAADLFVMPSRREGLGTALMDAMAAGCAVVATRTGGMPELVEDGKTGRLVPPGDPKALARAMAEVLGDPRQRENFGRMASAHASRHFGRETMVDGNLAVYRELYTGCGSKW